MISASTRFADAIRAAGANGTVTIATMTPSTFTLLLSFIYGHLQTHYNVWTDIEQIFDLFVAAHQYQLAVAMDRCLEALSERIAWATVARIAVFGHANQLSDE